MSSVLGLTSLGGAEQGTVAWSALLIGQLSPASYMVYRPWAHGEASTGSGLGEGSTGVLPGCKGHCLPLSTSPFFASSTHNGPLDVRDPVPLPPFFKAEVRKPERLLDLLPMPIS